MAIGSEALWRRPTGYNTGVGSLDEISLLSLDMSWLPIGNMIPRLSEACIISSSYKMGVEGASWVFVRNES